MDLIVRPARPADREAVFAFTRETWEGGDYIPEVWERWLSDRAGQLYVAALDDRPIGLGRASLSAPGYGWLEGIRVDPAHRRRGVARRLVEYGIEACRQRGAVAVGFVTAQTNWPMQRLADQAGFQRVGAFVPLEAEPLAGPARLVRSGVDRLAEAWELVQRCSAWRRWGGLECLAWTWRPLGPRHLAEHLERGAVLALPGPKLTALAIIGATRRQRLEVRFVAGEDGALGGLARAIRTTAAAGQWPGVFAMLPAAGPELPAFISQGYRRVLDHEMWVYQRSLAASG